MQLRVDGVALPDTQAVKAAVALAREASSPMLFNHVMRSAFLAELFGALRGAAVDREAMALAAILHDLGLTGHVCGPERFEIRGAHAARTFAREAGLDESRSWLVWDTIALHTHDLNLHKQPEAWGVQMGILADVLGIGLDGLEARRVEILVAAFPRLGFKRCFVELLKEEAGRGAELPPFHPSLMIRHHCEGPVAIPDAAALIGAAPFDE